MAKPKEAVTREWAHFTDEPAQEPRRMPMAKSKEDMAGKWVHFTDEQARGRITEPTEPVAAFPIKYIWHTGPWYDIFDQQIQLIRRDIQRAKAEDKLIIYLSCPISGRGGGYAGTNVDVARHVERALLERWGEAFWILNPAQYQLESKAGTGLINRHADFLGIDLDRLEGLDMPFGGDYMRMWTTVLVENGAQVGLRHIENKKLLNTGQFFDAFYFIGPRDVQSFFLKEGETITAGVQAYFARKFATDSDFRTEFSEPAISWKKLGPPSGSNKDEYDARGRWTLKRFDFLRYYSLRASANFSLGSHDEWLIFYNLNRRRLVATGDPAKFVAAGDASELLAGFFDGGQIDLSSSQEPVSHGYSCKTDRS